MVSAVLCCVSDVYPALYVVLHCCKRDISTLFWDRLTINVS